MKLPRLKEVRELHGWSQAKLAEESDVSRDSISNYETGQREAWPATAKKLADALHVEIADLSEPARELAASGKAEAPREAGRDEPSVVALVHEAALQEDKASRQANNRAEESSLPQVRFAHAENAVMPRLLGRLKDEVAEAAFEFALLAVKRDRQLTESEKRNVRLKEENARLKEENTELRAEAEREATR